MHGAGLDEPTCILVHACMTVRDSAADVGIEPLDVVFELLVFFLDG